MGKDLTVINGNKDENKLAVNQKRDNIEYVIKTFNVGHTVKQLQHMMDNVITEAGLTPQSIQSACNCVTRMNETINTALRAAEFLDRKR